MQFTVVYRSRFVIQAYEGWIKKGSKVIDIGLGDGIIADEVRKHFKCDSSGTDIIDSRKRKLPLVLGTAHIADQSYDIATMTEMLHHCKNWREVLKEAKRVARKVLIFECDPSFYAHYACIAANVVHYGTPNWRKFKTIEEWGFDVAETRRIETPWWYPFKYYSVRL